MTEERHSPPGRVRLSWVEVTLTAVLLAIGLVGTGPAARNNQMPAPPFAYVLVVIAALGILLWRVRPLWNLAITGSATMLYLALGYAYGPILFTQAIAAFGAALWLPLRQALLATGAVVAAALALAAVGAATSAAGWGEFGLTAWLAIPAWLVIPAAVGVAVKSRRDATAEVRAARARRAVSDERLRLAQEVHDVAGHGFAVIAMQAGVALHVLDRDPAAARAALEGIRAASRDALDGLRAEVEALRQGSSTSVQAPLRPRSGIADLPSLGARMRAAGLPVTLDLPPSTVEVGAAVDFAAYRIVQEALTNVLRHAGPQASAWVTLRVADSSLVITVRDNGRGAVDGVADDHAGHGIDGMAERAASVGGTLAAGPVPGGGFVVTAVVALSTGEGES
jgi:signal transduction histidine kinase